MNERGPLGLSHPNPLALNNLCGFLFPVRSRETNPNSGKITQVQPLDATVAYRSARGGPVDDLEIAHKVFVSDERLGSTGGELGGPSKRRPVENRIGIEDRDVRVGPDPDSALVSHLRRCLLQPLRGHPLRT